MSRIVIIFISLFLLTTMSVITAGFAQTNWQKYPGNPVLDVGTSGAWDENGVIAHGMLFDSTTYHMWYTGFDLSWNIRLGYTMSSDAITWTKHGSNPILDAGAQGTWDQGGPGSPSVIFNDNSYHMWYDATDSSGNIRIGYATSPDRVTWTKHGANPVLEIGSSGEWDDEGVFNPTVIFDDATYHMWYGGWDSLNSRIGYATSLDGITWTKSPNNPVLDLGSPGSWDDAAILGPSVIFDDATYHMWYGGGDSIDVGTPFTHDGSIGYATSPDGVTWTKSLDDPVLVAGSLGTWDEFKVCIPEVIYKGSTYHMWYNGLNNNIFPFRIGYAVDSTTTLVSELNDNIPTAFSLQQNYPNPFNPSTKISYQLPKSSFVKLSIYDIGGKLVETLVDQKQNAGYYSIRWDANHYSSGVYIYRIQVSDPANGGADGFTAVKKCLLIK